MSNPTPKTSAQIWTDAVKDFVGVDKGYVFTLKAIYTSPNEVFDSYFNNKGKYLSPFALLSISFALYYMVSGFLVDWELVAAEMRNLLSRLIEWEGSVLNKYTGKGHEGLDAFDRKFISSTVSFTIAGVSKYLIAIVIPMELIMLYCGSLFTRKLGFGFNHHFVSFNYFLSFSLLFFSVVILIGLINVWLLIPCVFIYNYLFYGHWFKSYGDKSKVVRKELMKGFALGFFVVFALAIVAGLTIGFLNRGG